MPHGSLPAPGRGSWLVVLLSLVGLAVLVGARRTGTWDLFFHLSTGRELWRSRGHLPVDPFSYAAAGQPWLYKDLLADVLLYLGFTRLGYGFLVLLKGAAVLGLSAALWLCADPRRPRALPFLLSLLLLLCAVQYRVVERPLLFSLVLFPLLLALLERRRRGAGRWFTPALLCWLWVQFHREALVGPPLLLAFAVYSACVERRRGVPAAAAALLSLLLLPLNPCGLATLRTTLNVGTSEFFRQAFMDWRALSPAQLLSEFPYAVGLSLAALAGCAALLLRRLRGGAAALFQGGGEVDLWHLGLLVLFLEETLRSSRYVPYLASTAAVVLLRVLQEAQRGVALPPRTRGLLGALLLAGGAALLHHGSQRPLGVGPLADHYPEAAVAFAKGAGLRPRVVNPIEFGGYLQWAAWPQFQVLIDGRADAVYTLRQIQRGLASQLDGRLFGRMRKEDGADWVLAMNQPGLESHGFLDGDPAWGLLYVSEPAVIYVRRDAYPALEGQLFRHYNRSAPFASIERAAQRCLREPAQRPAIEAEMRRLLEGSPSGVLTLSQLALFYHRLGEPGPRDRLVAQLRAQHPEHPATLNLPRLLGP